jgi:hypothetical protein
MHKLGKEMALLSSSENPTIHFFGYKNQTKITLYNEMVVKYAW